MTVNLLLSKIHVMIYLQMVSGKCRKFFVMV